MPAGGVVVNANYPPEVSSVTYSQGNENITIEFSRLYRDLMVQLLLT